MRERTKVIYDHGPMGWVLFVAWVGAFIYFYNLHPGFGGFFLAFLQSIVWPAYVVYEGLQAFGVR